MAEAGRLADTLRIHVTPLPAGAIATADASRGIRVVRAGSGGWRELRPIADLHAERGQAYCMGANRRGQLGTTATIDMCRLSETLPIFGCATVPVPVTGRLTFDVVNPGAEFVCGLTRDGRAFCWGSNDAGQLGTFAGAESFAPVRVPEALRLP